MTTSSPQRAARLTRVLSLLWVGRLSWLRIALALAFGERTLELVQSWHNDVPQNGGHGWVMSVVPQGVTELLLSYPNRVAGVVIVLIVLSVIGLGSRPALFLLVLIGLFARAVSWNNGIFDHESSLTTQVLFVLVFAPGTNAVSLEHVVRWWRGGRKDLLATLTAPYRQWGVMLILALLAVTYTASGLSKLRFGGFEWLNGETLGFYLRGLTAGDTVYLVGDGTPTWRDDFGLQMYTFANPRFGQYEPAALAHFVDWMAHTPAVMAVFATATVLLELAGFLLFVPRLRSVLLVGYIGMHTTIGLLMGLPFHEYQIICLFLIEWERIVPFVLNLFARKRDSSHVDSASLPPDVPRDRADSSGR
ncbi:hypothetical protein [Microbacterium sulfonylureivorans]|uniref:hypothetical protein n=1 Tax=Microbacterium sulfonylureivorans TaxID=2486854 RepID=UPI000FD835B7|nr:hypothetical protein [Microbacterium sulfonylureivorans]